MRGDLAGAGFAGNLETLAAGEPQEVPGISLQVEADEIRAEQAAHDFFAPRQLAEEIGRGKRDVQEEPNGEIGAFLAQDAGQEL